MTELFRYITPQQGIAASLILLAGSIWLIAYAYERRQEARTREASRRAIEAYFLRTRFRGWN